MAASARDLKLRLLFDYQTGGLKAAAADLLALQGAAADSSEELSSAAMALVDLGSSAADASGGLSDAIALVDELAAAGGGLSDIQIGDIDPSGLEGATAAADGLAGSLDAVDPGGLADVGAAADEVGGRFSGLSDVLARLREKLGDAASGLKDIGSGLAESGARVAGLAGPAAAAGGIALGAIGLLAAGALKLGDTFDGAYDTIAIKTGLTGDALEGLQGTVKDVFSSVPVDIDQATAAVAGFGQALDIVGDVEALSVQVLNLSRITGTDAATNTEVAVDTFARWKIAADDQSMSLDLLFEASQRARIPVDQLAGAVNDNAAALSSAGLDFEQSVELVTRLSAAGIDATAVMPGLSRVLVTAAKDGKDGSTALADLVAGIQGAGSAADAEQLAVAGFGKSGIKMAQAIRDGTLSLDELQGGLQRADGQINSTAANTDDFAQKLVVMKNKALVALEPFGAAALSAANGFVDSLEPAIDSVMSKVSEFGSNFQEQIGSFQDDGFGPLTGALGGLGAALSETWPAAAPLGEALQTLAALGDRIVTAFGEGGLTGVLSNLPDIFADLGIDPAIAASVTNLIKTIQEAFGGGGGGDFDPAALFARIVDGISSALPGLLDFGATVTRVIGFLIDNKEIVAKVTGLFAGLYVLAPLVPIVTGLGSAFVALMGFLAPAGVAVTGIGSALGVLATILTGPVGLAIAGVVAGFLLWRAKGDEIKAWFSDFGAGIKEFFSGLSDFKLPDLSGLLSGLTSIKLPSLNLASMFGGEGEAEARGAAAGMGLVAGLRQSVEGLSLPTLDLSGLLAGVPELGGNLVASFQNFLQEGDLPGLVSGIIDGIAQEWLGLPDSIVASLQGLGAAASQPVQAAMDSLRTLLSGAWASFQTDVIAPAQQAIFDYLHEQWLAIPEDIRADLLLIASELRERFDDFLLTVQTKTAEIRSDIQARFDEVVAIVTSALSAAYAVAQEKFEEIRLAITTAAVAARDAAADVFGQIASAIGARVDAARAAVQQGFDRVRIAAEERLDAARDAIAARVEAWRALVQAKVAELVAAAHAAFDPIVARLREVADRAVASLREGLDRARDAVITPILDALASLAAAATDAKERALGIARGVIDGLLSGIRSGKQAVVDLMLDLVRGALDQVKAFLGMNSPARRLIPYGFSVPEGFAVGVVRATPLAVAAMLAMGRAVAVAASEIEPFSSADFFLVDEAAEQRFLADALSQLATLEAELDAAGAAFKRAQGKADAAKGPIQDALAAFFSAGGADGLSGIVSQIEQLSGSGLGADFFTNAGLDAESFADLQRQIESLADEPAKQQQLWQSMIDALGERWKDYYDEQLEAEEKKAKALKRSIQEAKKAGPDADTSELDSQLVAVEERIASLKDQNDQVADTLKEQASTVGNQFERYERLAKVANERKQDEEAARRALEEQRRALEAQVKERQGQALDAETRASELAGRLLDDELEREERNHNARLRFLDAQISAEEEALRQSLADEEERHTEALANITAEVDARQAAIDAQMDDLSRAKNLLDSFAKGNALTGEQSDFLRSLGLDPEVLGDAAVGLAETQKQVESLQGLLSRLDKGSSKRITKDQISQAERQALEDLKASGKLTKDEARRVDVALQSKGGISQKQLAALLERAAGGEKGSEGFLQQQLTQQEQGLDLLEKEIARREAKAKATQDDLAAERAGLQGLIDAEEHRHEAALAGARDRLTALNAERDAEEASFRDFQDHIREAKDAEKDRHDERMRQIQEQYALELLRLGKTEEEVRQILKEQEQRAAAIAEEARRRAEAAKAEAAAADSRVDPASPPSDEPPPASSGGEPPFAPLPIQPIIPPGTVDGLRSQLEDGDITGGLAASLSDDLRAGTQDGLRALREDGALAGRDFAAALLDPALESVAALRGRMVDIRSLATDLGLTPSLASGDVAIDRRIVFNGPVTLDHELAEELGILDVARTGAP